LRRAGILAEHGNRRLAESAAQSLPNIASAARIRKSPMKAFLSHSSKDKYFVGQVAASLGTTQIEYDQHTFEFTLNAQAIRRALSRSDLFVAFLSSNSITSSFVTEEQRAALEARGRGNLEKVMVFAIDNTSYRMLPDWLREINVVQQLSSAKGCARRIQSALIALDAEKNRVSELYIGREEDEKRLRRVVSAPPKETPIAIHAVGHHGIGRRTFLRRSLTSLYPRVFEVFPEVTLGVYAGIEDFFRSIYHLHVVSPLSQTIADLEAFANKDYPAKLSQIIEIVREMAANGELLTVVDDGGVYTDEGDYQPFFADLISALSPLAKPAVCFVQTRMMPLARQKNYIRSFHTYLRPLSDDTVKDLISLSLNERGIDFTAQQVLSVAEHLDGHPFNVKFAVQYIAMYGIDILLNDPSELIEWKRRRAEDFLSRLEFNSIQIDVLAALTEYRYLAADMLFAILSNDPAELARNLRALEEFCCIERRENYYHISAPIREAVRRDMRFERSDGWKQSIGAAICEAIKDYKDDDFISVPILESATMAAARGGKAPAFLSHLVLPSHLLRIARDFYDRARRKDCIEFCERAYALKHRLPEDAQIEALRLWGLSAIRLGRDYSDALNRVMARLRTYTSKTARRNALFLEGFKYRFVADWDKAEEKYLAALALSPGNQSINRELASLYCKERRYAEAETYARAAYRDAPTNPFILDILAETLLGKQHFGLPVDRDEIRRIQAELKIYGDAPGSSFFLVRDGQEKARDRNFPGALASLDKAIERTPTLLSPYFIRADVRLQAGDVLGAERDLEKINQLLTDAGGLSEGDEARAAELEIRIMIDKKQFQAAKDKAERSVFLPRPVANRLLRQLSRVIGFEPDAASDSLRKWASRFG
jgi:tetratricopeptide (TPR) repeat protein